MPPRSAVWLDTDTIPHDSFGGLSNLSVMNEPRGQLSVAGCAFAIQRSLTFNASSEILMVWAVSTVWPEVPEAVAGLGLPWR